MDRAVRVGLPYVVLNGILAFVAIRLYRIMRPHAQPSFEYLWAILIVLALAFVVVRRPYRSNPAVNAATDL